MSREKYRIRLDAFEGPYDLLLYLIREDEVDIHQIQISRILEQYLHYLEDMVKDLTELDEAADFFVVAATLMRIKSRSLLPYSEETLQEESELEEIQSRRQLIEKLLAYQDIKMISYFLERRQSTTVSFDNLCPYEYRHVREVDTSNLTVQEMLKVFQKYSGILHSQDWEITRDPYRMADYSRKLLSLLRKQKAYSFLEFTSTCRDIREFITCFLALLELAREKKIHFEQDQKSRDINMRIGKNV